jgi:hypothetical protein
MTPMTSEELAALGGAYECSPEQRRDASRFVLRHARCTDDLRILLDVLGLNTPKEA